MSAQNTLAIHICASVEEAPNYSHDQYKSISIEQVNLVRKGTEAGRSTVDFVLVDESGQKYVVMLTGRVVHSLAAAIGAE